jgi:hypothetical protein
VLTIPSKAPPPAAALAVGPEVLAIGPLLRNRGTVAAEHEVNKHLAVDRDDLGRGSAKDKPARARQNRQQ